MWTRPVAVEEQRKVRKGQWEQGTERSHTEAAHALYQGELTDLSEDSHWDEEQESPKLLLVKAEHRGEESRAVTLTCALSSFSIRKGLTLNSQKQYGL